MLNPTIFSHIPLSSADSTNIAQNIGIDKKWGGPYPPVSGRARAFVIADSNEHHAVAEFWSRRVGIQQNWSLLG